MDTAKSNDVYLAKQMHLWPNQKIYEPPAQTIMPAVQDVIPQAPHVSPDDESDEDEDSQEDVDDNN